MVFTKSLNYRRRIDREAMRNRDAEVLPPGVVPGRSGVGDRHDPAGRGDVAGEAAVRDARDRGGGDTAAEVVRAEPVLDAGFGREYRSLVRQVGSGWFLGAVVLATSMVPRIHELRMNPFSHGYALDHDDRGGGLCVTTTHPDASGVKPLTRSAQRTAVLTTATTKWNEGRLAEL